MISIPEKLFRFRSFNHDSLSNCRHVKRLESEIENALESRTWFSCLDDQNDPFDCRPSVEVAKSYEYNRLFKYFQKEIGQKYAFTGASFREISNKSGKTVDSVRKQYYDTSQTTNIIFRTMIDVRKNTFICCFSEKFDNILLWSYYSNCHSGFCYEFVRKERDNSYATLFERVKYQKFRPIISTDTILKHMDTSDNHVLWGLVREFPG